jgi:acetyltransferase-like isoleucine patch superfamily enzyme/2-polyprenyl-3-methyl-5-hydroxy-6-metoxy-1,4-benzoquinol methylase
MHIGRHSVISPQAIIEEPENVVIGDHVQIKAGVVLRPETGFIVIGNHVVINHYTVIHGKGGVEIGDWCIIAPHCGLFAQNHSFDSFDWPITLQPNRGRGITLMGDNWLGAGAIVLDGVTLGKGTVVGAGAVVTKSFPMAKVLAGNPARIIKDRAPRDTWDFRTAERAVVDLTPPEYWPHIERRAAFGVRFLTPADAVLDLGCGDGYLTQLFREKCGRIIGIDYCEEAVATARERFGLDCRHMSCTALDFPPASFDVVTCFELLEHLTRLQAKRTVAESHRVLKPGGRFVGSTPVRPSPGGPYGTYSHIHEYTAAELRALLAPFAQVEITGDYFLAVKG